MARAATPAIAALVAAELPHEVFQYHHDPRGQAFGNEAVAELAAAKDADPEQIFKTLVVAIPTGLAVAVVPVPAKLSLKAVAAALAVPRATMADPAAAQRSSGYVLGGISPLVSASRCRRWSTSQRWSGIGCGAARGNAVSRSASRPSTSSP